MILSLRILSSVLLWFLFSCLRTVLIVLGWILIPIALSFKAYAFRESSITGRTKLQWTWKLMWAWSNEEDGIYAGEEFPDAPFWFRILYWTAFRNPVNNLRYISGLNCKVNPFKIWYTGTFGALNSNLHRDVLRLNQHLGSAQILRKYDTKVPQWFFCWQGIYSCFYWQFYIGSQLYRLWIGWKLYPTDIFGVTEYRKHGAGFANQFKRVR